MKNTFNMSCAKRTLWAVGLIAVVTPMATVHADTVSSAWITKSRADIMGELSRYSTPTIYMDRSACGEPSPNSAVACSPYTISVGQRFMQNQETKYGNNVGKFVLAHEWGHTIQFARNIRNRSPYQELQADCVAGTFAKYAEAAPLKYKAFIENAVKSARDYADNSTHGTSAQRDYYARYGYAKGLASCLAIRM